MSGTERNKETDPEIETLLRAVGAREQPSPEATAAVRDAVRAEWQQIVQERRRVRRRTITFAAAASVLLVAGIVLYALPRWTEGQIVARVDRVVGAGASLIAHGTGVPLLPNATVRTDQALRTPAYVRVAFQLAPHLEVRMDQDSEAKFVAADRIVLYRGALYVDAAGAQGRPLTLETPLGNVQHVGTQYDARLADGVLRVRVRTGEVALLHDSQLTTAQAGEQLRISVSGLTREEIAVSGPEWLWVAQVAPAFNIENRSLADFLAWCSQETGYEIVYASERARDAARQVILHGSVAGLTPDSALAAVLSTTRFTYTQTANRITIALRP